MTEKIKLFLPLAIVVFLWLIPSTWIPISNLTVIEHRVICLFLLAALYWILEPIPVYTTSVLIIVLLLVLCSDKGLYLFKTAGGAAGYGTELSYREIMATFASPIILLFLGGFFLAMAATKFRLDLNLARIMLQPFGKDPKWIMLGLMIITAIFSMFMSNTATTAMMIAIVTPVVAVFHPEDKGQIAILLSIPFAANVGGLGTPIGTPPNAIALKYLTGENAVSFGEWMVFAVPFVIVMLLFTWMLLLFMYKPTAKEVALNIESKFLKNWKAYTVYITFTGTILLWLTDRFHGMNSYVIAMIPVAVFSVTQIINKEDLKRISWDVLWLVAGGIALGTAMEKSGLSSNLIASIPFATYPPLLIVFLFTFVTLLMGTFMSHTAAANLILPIVAALGANLETLFPYGGSKMLVLAATFAASLAMALVISTPPNAIAYSSGKIESRQLLVPGAIIGVVGLAAVYLLMYILHSVNFV